MGVRDGDRVALALPDVEDFVVALHGCFLSGAVAVPVDLRLTEEERAARLAGAEVVLASLPSPEQRRDSPRRLWATRRSTLMHTSGTTAAPKQVVLTHGTGSRTRWGRRSRWGSILPSAGFARCR